MSESFRDLVAWQKAMQFATDVYRVTETFPRSEQFGLTQQIRRSVNSVPSNIAEGKGRQTTKDYVQFLYRARGSALEAETQLEIAHNVGFLDRETFARLLEQSAEVGRVLNGLISKTLEWADS